LEGHQTLDNSGKNKNQKDERRKMNGSGFFLFNEEDMKSMTEMSPKGAAGKKQIPRE